MNYLSVCSGIEAASVAWDPLGFRAVGFSEIEKFPSQVLAHRYPTVRNYGDMTKYKEWEINAPIDILVGGTPCQSFSVAGLRKGLEDPRGNLMLTYLAIADRLRPKWVVWENVPGVLSSHGGRDFGTFLGALVELGYGFAYRVLDAQWFGVAQRRRRVFVVGCLGDATSAAKVLFESESVCRNPAPSREKGKGFATNVAPSLTASNNPSRSPQSSEVTQQVNAILEAKLVGTIGARTCRSIGVQDAELGDIIVGSLDTECGGGKLTHQSAVNGHLIGVDNKGCWWDGSQVSQTLDAVLSKGQMMPEKNRFPVILQPITGDNQPAVAFAQNTRDEVRLVGGDGQIVGALAAQPGMKQTSYIAFTAAEARRTGTIQGSETVPTLTSQAKGGDTEPCVSYGSQVRRLTPMECERLQGFPDGWTDIKTNGKPTPDGPRYKAIGNSMAVPVMRWIGERIHASKAALDSL